MIETEALNYGVRILQKNNGYFKTKKPQIVELANQIYESYPIFGNRKVSLLVAQAAYQEYSKLN